MPTKPTPELPQENLAEAFSTFAETLKQALPRKHVTLADFNSKTAFNPTGAKRKLPVVVYQNGTPLNERVLSDKEIALLAKFSTLDKNKTLRFCHGKVTVWQDLGKPERPWHINYDNRKPLEVMQEFRSFEELLTRITTEKPEE